MYYGFLESISIKNDYIDLEFDSFEESLLPALRQNNNLQPKYEDTYHISLQVPNNREQKFKLDQWYFLSIGESQIGGSIQQLFSSQKNIINLKIKEIKKIDGRSRDGKDLNRIFSFSNFLPATKDQIESMLPRETQKNNYVAVYDVGQGNCNALCKESAGVLLYYDFGADMRTNSIKFQRKQQYCITHNPIVILSHWDKDHWFASNYFPQIKNMQWIVPDQNLGISHKVFANELHANKKLLIWPKGLTNIKFPFGEIVKCTGKSRNDSGLALHISLNKDNQIKNILLPGDCAYRFIPHIPKSLHGLVGSHHGGNIYGYIPVPANINCTTVFSVSSNSQYGHPLPKMVKKIYKFRMAGS